MLARVIPGPHLPNGVPDSSASAGQVSHIPLILAGMQLSDIDAGAGHA